LGLSGELVDQPDALVSTNELVGYSEQKMPELRAGSETDREAIRIYVDAKYPARDLSPAELLPDELEGQPVDVVAVGRPERLSTGAPHAVAEEVQSNPKTKIRPGIGGISGGLSTPPETGTLRYFVQRGDAMCGEQQILIDGGSQLFAVPADSGGVAGRLR
jgi:hypothetical protein